MAKEIERKFLVEGNGWRSQSVRSESICQGYLTGVSPGSTVEVRVRRADDRAFLTVKSKGGLVRHEFEYSIPESDAKFILEELCGSHVITKIRHHVEDGEYMWFVDEFVDQHRGLTVAEIELRTVYEKPRLPNWIGVEVTDDPRYRNAHLAQNSKEST